MSTTTETIDTTNDVNLDDFSAEFFGQDAVETTETETTDEVEEDKEDSTESDAPLEEKDDDTHDDGENDDDSATEDEDDTDDEEEEAEEEAPAPKPKKNRFQERIDKLVQEREEEKRERIALQQRLEQLEAKRNTPDPDIPAADKTTTKDTAPDPDATNEDGTDKYPLGQFDPQYQADLVKHLMQTEREAYLREVEIERSQQAQQEASQALHEEWNTKLQPAQERYPDFMEKATTFVDSFSDLDADYGEYLSTVIKSMDYGPDVLYYLADHPEEAAAIVNGGAQKATIALGRIESQFIETDDPSTRSPDKVKTTNAPKPPTRLNKGTSVSKGSVAPDTDDLDAFSSEFFKKRKG